MTATTKMKWGLTKGEEKIFKIASSSDSPQLFQQVSYELNFTLASREYLSYLRHLVSRFNEVYERGTWVMCTLILSMHIRECTS